MRTFLRVVAGVNAIFQGLVGTLSVASPTSAASLFQLEGLTPATLAVIRMLGGLLIGSAVLSAVIAKNPEKNPNLPAAYAVTCLMNLTTDSLVCLSGAMRFSQLALGMLLQAILVLAIVANLRSAPAGQPASRAL